MKAKFNTVSNRQLELNVDFPGFLASGLMRRQALQSMCTPEQVVTDYLSPSVDLDDPMEVREAFAEACELATGHELENVRLDDTDMVYIRQHILGSGYNPPPAHAQPIPWPIAA